MERIAATIAIVIAVLATTVWAGELLPIEQQIEALNPRLGPRQIARYARAVYAASQETRIEPAILVAVGYRESGWRPDIERGRIRGRRGETGIMQVMPGGVALQWARGCRQTQARCSVRTGARYLAWLRDEVCPGSTWRWLAGYSRSRCLSEEEARRAHDVLAARRIYCSISPDCDSSWPP